MVANKIKLLRDEMAKRKISIYIIPTSDYHESEYVGEYFKAREFITGFTGSNGTAVITMNEANLWTDGRYFIQAEKQLAGTEIILRKMGEPGVPKIDEYIRSILKADDIIGFDGRVINAALGKEFEELANNSNASIYADEDLVDLIWESRPQFPATRIFSLDISYTGEDTASKLSRIRQELDKSKATVHLLSSLCDIAWILNIRGNDISYVPVTVSFMAISKSYCYWFVNSKLIDAELADHLDKNNIIIKNYEDFYTFVESLSENEAVLFNDRIINYKLAKSIPSGVSIINAADPSNYMKAIKNPVQLENLRKAHLKDAVAMCRFMYWLKTNIGKLPMSEISVSDYLYELRAKLDGFIELSFATISGYNENGAIVHYCATNESNKTLEAHGLLLVDSGAHYLEGTTDITRTFALGELTEDMKENFTRVCRSNMNLANARFLYGCSGENLDILAREPLWEAGLDYKHGTGHGVGYILNVHEGPNSFRWRIPNSKTTPLEEGMITTDEPGIYIENNYGIRTENELICRKDVCNEYGQFMHFENLTYVPIDLDAIIPERMTSKEREYLNSYHKMVYEKVSPLLSNEEAEWLKVYTRAI